MNLAIPIELTENLIRQCTYSVFVDIDNDGTCEEDITKDVDAVNYIDVNLEMKNTGMVLGKPSVSISSITLFNEDGKYSFSKTSSPYFGKFKRNTKVYIEGGFIDSDGNKRTIGLFTGVITGFRDTRQTGNNKMVVTLKDYAKFAQRKKNPDVVLFNKTLSYAVDYLITYVYGEDFPREIQGLEVVYPVIEFEEGGYVWNSLQKLCEACDGRIFFEHDKFKFITPHSSEYNFQESPVYTFTGKNIFNFIQSVDEENIINKWTITSEAKVLQPRQVVVGTPSTNSLTDVVEYVYNDGKNALGVDKKTITLKYQEDLQWINTINVPLVEDFTYIDYPNTPTQEDIDLMNQNAINKVFNKNTGEQLTVYSIDYKNGKIVLKDPITDPEYRIQVTYQYYTDRIISGKYKWYNFELEDITANLFDQSKVQRRVLCIRGLMGIFFGIPFHYHTEIIGLGVPIPRCPICDSKMSVATSLKSLDNLILEAHDGYELVNIVLNQGEQGLFLTDWVVSENNKNIKFRLCNNLPIRHEGTQLIDTLYLSKMEIYGNPLKCISPLKVVSVGGDITEAENAYEIQNDYIIDQEYAQQVCDEYYHKYSIDRSFLEVTTKGIPQIEMLDRVRIIDTISGIDYDFIVIGYKHTIKKDGWKTNLTLESLVPAWEFDPSNVEIIRPRYNPQSAVTLPTINILRDHGFEDVFQGNNITHSVIIEFEPPMKFNVANFLEGKILLQEQLQDGGLGRYIHIGSFTEQETNMFKITGLETGKQYKAFVVLSNKYGATSFYGDGYLITTPTLEELKTTYLPIIAPINVQLIKALNGKFSVSCNAAPPQYPHYKTTRFEMVKEGKTWADESVQIQFSDRDSVIYDFPSEETYKIRVAYVDIWDRVGVYSAERTINGGVIDLDTLPKNLFEIEIFAKDKEGADYTPDEGFLDQLIDGEINRVVFDRHVEIVYKYPYEHIFDLIRFRTPANYQFYVEYLEQRSEPENWISVAGTSESPLTSLINVDAAEANVFEFHKDGNMTEGEIIKRKTNKMRITFPFGCILEELIFGTYGYFDSLKVKEGDIKSAHIENLQAEKLLIGNDPASFVLTIDPVSDVLFRFDNSLFSTKGLNPVGME